eukprot:312647-Prorocentrum_lima.AAC.1
MSSVLRWIKLKVSVDMYCLPFVALCCQGKCWSPACLMTFWKDVQSDIAVMLPILKVSLGAALKDALNLSRRSQ